MSAGHGQIHKKNVYPKSYSSYNLRMEKKTGFYNIFSKTIQFVFDISAEKQISLLILNPYIV